MIFFLTILFVCMIVSEMSRKYVSFQLKTSKSQRMYKFLLFHVNSKLWRVFSTWLINVKLLNRIFYTANQYELKMYTQIANSSHDSVNHSKFDRCVCRISILNSFGWKINYPKLKTFNFPYFQSYHFSSHKTSYFAKQVISNIVNCLPIC